MLEGARGDINQRQRFIYEFDPEGRRYKEERRQYRVEDPEHT